MGRWAGGDERGNVFPGESPSSAVFTAIVGLTSAFCVFLFVRPQQWIARMARRLSSFCCLCRSRRRLYHSFMPSPTYRGIRTTRYILGTARIKQDFARAFEVATKRVNTHTHTHTTTLWLTVSNTWPPRMNERKTQPDKRQITEPL